MFTGIVEAAGIVESLESSLLCIRAKMVLDGLKKGDSIAVNGACLTVVSLDGEGFCVDLAPETVRRTNLGTLVRDQIVNLERPVTPDGRLGGHIVQGHVDGRGKVLSIRPEGKGLILGVKTPKRLIHYIVEKGFVAVDGISLTVVRRAASSFTVSVIPYTAANTNLKHLRRGNLVNLEMDVLAKYIESLLKARD